MQLLQGRNNDSGEGSRTLPSKILIIGCGHAAKISSGRGEPNMAEFVSELFEDKVIIPTPGVVQRRRIVDYLVKARSIKCGN